MFCPNCAKAERRSGSVLPELRNAAIQANVTATIRCRSVAASYAGFWVRVVALIIDLIIISVAGGLVATVTMGAGVVSDVSSVRGSTRRSC